MGKIKLRCDLAKSTQNQSTLQGAHSPEKPCTPNIDAHIDIEQHQAYQDPPVIGPEGRFRFCSHDKAHNDQNTRQNDKKCIQDNNALPSWNGAHGYR